MQALLTTNSEFTMTKPNLERIENMMTHALNSFDYYGASGAMTICVFPESDCHLRAGGVCTDLTGAVMALYAATTAFRAKAEKDGATEVARVLNEVAHLLAPALATNEKRGVH